MRTIHILLAFLLALTLNTPYAGAGGDETGDDSWLPKVTKLENGDIQPILEKYKGEVICYPPKSSKSQRKQRNPAHNNKIEKKTRTSVTV